MIENLIQQVEKRLFEELRALADTLSTRFPALKIQVYSHSVGSLTEYQGHDIGIDCIFPNTTIEQPDNVALSVSLYQLTTIPMINADIAWGHPSGHVEAEFSSDWVEVTDETLEHL